MKKLFVLLAFLLCSIDVVSAGQTIYLNPTDEYGINGALETAKYSSGITTVFLNPGIYELRGPVIIYSNTVLSGDPNAILRVSSSSSQWFKGQTGVICNPMESLQNVEICGFQIDGNIGNLPRSYDSTPGHDRDCEKLILIGGWSSQPGNNIKIHDMKLYNAFSDGAYIRFTNNVQFYNNIISNCQHEGFFFSCVTNGLVFGNKIAGITSDCGRLDNCQYCKVYDNIFFSYDGNSYGAYKHGENGLQIGDAGSSHGYDASDKPFSTQNIEVFGNTFADPGSRAIWLHKGANVYIHSNMFVDADDIETEGFSFDNSPSLETSEKVFNSIFDILRRDYTFQYLNTEQNLKASAEVVYHNYSVDPYSILTVEGEDEIEVIRVSYGGKPARHFVDRDMWVGEFQRVGNGWYIPGEFDENKLKITVYSKKGFKTLSEDDIKVENAAIGKAGINPDLFNYIAGLVISGISIIRSIRRIL